MKKLFALLAFCLTVPGLAATYTVNAGSSAATIQSTLNTAASTAGNTVVFSAGTYRLAAALNLPCSNGTIYTGANVGIVTQSNLPAAVLTSTVPTNYALSTNSNGTTLTGSQGCTIQYLRFSGTQGGIIVWYPASGIVIQNNAFDNDNPPAGGESSKPNIYITGVNGGFSAANGVQHISILWNLFFNNCAAIRAVAYPDSGGGCAATWVNGFNNYLTWSNNTVNLTEQGLKLADQSAFGITSTNADVENNNMQGNSRILIETQQDTNGVGTYSHNAFYQPYNPSYNTFGLSVPEYIPSISPTHTVQDNVFIAGVPVNLAGSAGHYGIGLELWGAGSIAENNLFQGGNVPDTCGAGWGCTGYGISVGEAFTNATITGNYFSGHDLWAGTANDVSMAVQYEDGGSKSNAGIVLSPNTVVETSATIPTVAPAISATSGTITLSDSDTSHRLSIFYTTDGTTPAIFPPGGSAGTSKVYTGPFTVASGATVKAIASWGQGANQGIVFPQFGYVPSSVTSMVVAAADRALTGARTLTGAYLHANANTVVKGSTLQFTAYGTYSDGSVGRLPDADGNAVTLWNTSNHALAKTSSTGHVTAMASGRVNVEATIGSLKSNPWTVTILEPGQAAPAVSEPAAAPRVAPAVPAPEVAAIPAVEAAAPSATPSAGATPSAAAAPGSPAPADAAPGTPVSATPAPASPVSAGSVPTGPVPASPGPPQPDTFLGPFWRLVTPAGGSASISNSHLFLGVPGGSNHDALQPSNQAVRVIQTIGNADFDVVIKIDSPLFATDGNTSQGLMVLHGATDFITFALTTDGNKIGLSAHDVVGGVATTLLQDGDFSQYQNPMYLRLTKTGSAYDAMYSLDGASWNQAASFTDTEATTGIGPFAGNYNEDPGYAVPVVMSVNWFDVQQ
jgi:hypothetical protein